MNYEEKVAEILREVEEFGMGNNFPKMEKIDGALDNLIDMLNMSKSQSGGIREADKYFRQINMCELALERLHMHFLAAMLWTDEDDQNAYEMNKPLAQRSMFTRGMKHLKGAGKDHRIVERYSFLMRSHKQLDQV